MFCYVFILTLSHLIKALNFDFFLNDNNKKIEHVRVLILTPWESCLSDLYGNVSYDRGFVECNSTIIGWIWPCENCPILPVSRSISAHSAAGASTYILNMWDTTIYKNTPKRPLPSKAGMW